MRSSYLRFQILMAHHGRVFDLAYALFLDISNGDTESRSLVWHGYELLATMTRRAISDQGGSPFALPFRWRRAYWIAQSCVSAEPGSGYRQQMPRRSCGGSLAAQTSARAYSVIGGRSSKLK